jgi:hypothetical protein
MPYKPDITVDSSSRGSESSSSTLLHLVQAQDPQAWQRLVDLYAVPCHPLWTIASSRSAPAKSNLPLAQQRLQLGPRTSTTRT